MTDVVLNNITSGYNIAKVNGNFQKIEDSINNDLINRSGGNNTMAQDLDINSNNLLNVENISVESIKLNGLTLAPETVVVTDAVLASDLSNTATGKGASLVGFLQAGAGATPRTMQNKARDIVHVSDFGALGDNSGATLSSIFATLSAAQSRYPFATSLSQSIDYCAIQAAMNYCASLGKVTSLDFGGANNIYRLSQPVKGTFNIHLRGNCQILPTATGFSGVTVPLTAGGSVTWSTLFYFMDSATAQNPSGSRRTGLRIDKHITFDCGYLCDYAVILDNYQDYTLSCNVKRANQFGIYVEYYGWGGKVDSYITDCVAGGLRLGAACNGISTDGMRVYGNSVTSTYGIVVDGDNNGVSIGGCFIEKVDYGVYFQNGCGAAVISGVDFEIITTYAVNIEGSSLAGTRTAGPVVVQGCFLSAGVAAVRANNARIIADGNRIKSTPLAFSALGTDSVIYERNNSIEAATVAAVYSGNVIHDNVLSRCRNQFNYIQYGGGTAQDTYQLKNYNYYYDGTLETSGLTFSGYVANSGTQRHLGDSVWYTNEMRANALYAPLGLRLNNSTGAYLIEPLVPASAGTSAGAHSLGSHANQFIEVYSQNIVLAPPSSVTPVNNGDMTFQLTSDTSLVIKVKGSDGTVRSATLPLA